MEYGLRIATLDSVFKNPGELLETNIRHSALTDLCPDAQLTALYFGSEFCQELIPGGSDAKAFCAHCEQHGLEAVLLTPIVTRRGLARIGRLLEDLTGGGWLPAVVFNDWGVLEMIRNEYPTVQLRMGRLMNRGLRDPRLDMRPPGARGENTQRGAGIRKLACSRGVTAIESDADLEPGYLGDGSEGLQRTIHLPFTFAASGRNCLEKAAASAAGKGIFTHGLNSGCTAPCRGVCRNEPRRDTKKKLWRAGNTLFFETPAAWIPRHLALADRVVLHEQPTP